MVERRGTKRARDAAKAKGKRNTNASSQASELDEIQSNRQQKEKTLFKTHVTETAPVLAERRGVEETDRAALEKDREQDMVL